MKFGPLIYHKRNIFLQNSCRKWGREASSRLLSFFTKNFFLVIDEVIESSLQVIFNISIAFKLVPNKCKLHKTLDYWSRDILTFNFLQKSLALASPPHCVYDFSKKTIIMLYSINSLNFIVWMALPLEILGYSRRLYIICFPGFNVINFEINLIFLYYINLILI